MMMMNETGNLSQIRFLNGSDKKAEKKEAKKALEGNLLSEDSDYDSFDEDLNDSPRGAARKVRVEEPEATHSIKRVKYKDSDVVASIKSLKAAKNSGDQANTLYGIIS